MLLAHKICITFSHLLRCEVTKCTESLLREASGNMDRCWMFKCPLENRFSFFLTKFHSGNCNCKSWFVCKYYIAPIIVDVFLGPTYTFFNTLPWQCRFPRRTLVKILEVFAWLCVMTPQCWYFRPYLWLTRNTVSKRFLCLGFTFFK